MAIRNLDQRDIPEAAEVLKAAYAQEPWNEQWSDERAQKRVRSILSNDSAIGLCAVQNGRICGCALGFVDPYAREDFFFLSELFVMPEYRRQGIGSALVGQLEMLLREKGIAVVQLMSIADNLDFYRRNGLEQDSVSVLFKRL